MNKNTAFVALLVILAIASWVISRSGPQRPSQAGRQAGTSSGISPMTKAPPSAANTPPPAERISPPPPIEVPSREKLREEVRANPERPPASLLTFSSELGRRTDQAIADRPQADAIMATLQRCTSDPNAADEVKAICIRNANRLAERYPELSDERDAIAKHASERARELVAALSSLRNPS